MYENGIIGSGNAQAFLNTTWMKHCILFGLQGTKENYDEMYVFSPQQKLQKLYKEHFEQFI